MLGKGILVAISLLAAASIVVAEQHSSRIVGGSPVPINQVPWQVALEKNGVFFCGGSVISQNYVLTSAYCAKQIEAVSDIQVRCGTNILQVNGTTVKVDQVSIHDSYDDDIQDNDAAILRLGTPLNLDRECTFIKLSTQEPPVGASCRVTGWGQLSEDSDGPATFLQEAILPILDRSKCVEALGGSITKNMLCAGTKGRDFCFKDSGGALTMNNVQVGIVSWGEGCDRVGCGVYSNIASMRVFISSYSNNEAQFQ